MPELKLINERKNYSINEKTYSTRDRRQQGSSKKKNTKNELKMYEIPEDLKIQNEMKTQMKKSRNLNLMSTVLVLIYNIISFLEVYFFIYSEDDDDDNAKLTLQIETYKTNLKSKGINSMLRSINLVICAILC